MYKKILVPLDGSTSAEHVLPLAHALAAKLPLAVELLGVVDTVELARGLATVERFYMTTLVADETRRTGGVSEGVLAALVDAGFGGTMARVTSKDSFVPLGAAANLVLLSEEEIEAAALRLVG